MQRVARRVAARFFAGYLRFTYGHATSDRTVHRLVGAPPRASPAVRRLRPRVMRLRLDWAGPTRVTVLATIRDGQYSYPVAIRLTRRTSGFRIVALEP